MKWDQVVAQASKMVPLGEEAAGRDKLTRPHQDSWARLPVSLERPCRAKSLTPTV